MHSSPHCTNQYSSNRRGRFAPWTNSSVKTTLTLNIMFIIIIIVVIIFFVIRYTEYFSL